MYDKTEQIRKIAVMAINSKTTDSKDDDRSRLEAEYGVGNVWSTDEVSEDFVIHSFLAPFVSVSRKVDGVEGLIKFQHSPRLYFDFKEDK